MLREMGSEAWLGTMDLGIVTTIVSRKQKMASHGFWPFSGSKDTPILSPRRPSSLVSIGLTSKGICSIWDHLGYSHLEGLAKRDSAARHSSALGAVP